MVPGGSPLRAVGEWAGPAVVSAVVLIVVGIASGGYLPRTWRLTTFALLSLAAAALIARRRIALGRLDWAFLAALVALTLWTAASFWWSDQPATSLLEGERCLVYLSGVAVVLLLVERATLPQLLGGAAAGITVVSAYGLAKFELSSPALNPIEGRLLFEPIGYSNGLGIFAAIGILLAGGLAMATSRWTLRAAALASLGVLVPTLYLTSSRGAWIALIAGLAVLLLSGRRLSRPLLAALATVAAVAVVGFVLASHERGETGILKRAVGENRPRYWHVAAKEYELHPFLGSGAGTFDNYWLHYRRVPSFARDAHSLYLESLAELGPFGLVLVLGTLGVPLLALLQARHALAPTAGAGYVAFLVHAGVDWDWELPAVTLAGLFCGAALVVAARGADERALSPRGRAVFVIAVVALAALALTRLETGPRLPFAS